MLRHPAALPSSRLGGSTSIGRTSATHEIQSPRSMVGVILQDTPLLHFQGREAAKKVHVHETIMHTPEKYTTKLGERGLMLVGARSSGG
ncbi:hypothetical protein C8Q80DRAFT_1160856 [Daedaleopsis nitida]|nr:hypothetical protein C8Q80DRAFT_1160856 [Daedaleopsis nitida]